MIGRYVKGDETHEQTTPMKPIKYPTGVKLRFQKSRRGKNEDRRDTKRGCRF